MYDREMAEERERHERVAKIQAQEDAAELERRKRLRAARTLEGFLYGAAAVALPEEPNDKADSSPVAPASQHHLPPPSAVPPSAALESKHRFLPPPSTTIFPRTATAARWGSGVPLTPASAMVGISPQFIPLPTTPASTSSWATSAEHHSVYIPPAPRNGTNVGDSDSLVLSRSKSSASAQGSDSTKSLKEWLEPYQPELIGPQPPTPDGSRWSSLEAVYLKMVIEPTTKMVDAAEEKRQGHINGDVEVENQVEAGLSSAGEARKGLSHALPRGASGIAPSVYLSRALQESRCGLFM